MQPDPVLITARELYEAIVRLTGRVDVLITQHSATEKDVADHEQRLRALESKRWPIQAVSLLVAIVAVLVSAAALLLPIR